METGEKSDVRELVKRVLGAHLRLGIRRERPERRVSSRRSSALDAPYIEHEDAKTKRPTPAAFAARATATVPSRLMA